MNWHARNINRQRGTELPAFRTIISTVMHRPRPGQPLALRYRNRPIWRRSTPGVIQEHETVGRRLILEAVKQVGTIDDNPENYRRAMGTIGDGKEMHKTQGKTHSETRLRGRCRPPLGVTMDDAAGRAHWALSSLG